MGKDEFFEPEMATRPLSGLPPVTTSFSMINLRPDWERETSCCPPIADKKLLKLAQIKNHSLSKLWSKLA
jgi:hypothetical protein